MNLNTKLSAHFTLREATFSATADREGIPNLPSPSILEVMKDTAVKMEAVRAILQCNPILVTSWFRSLDLNKRIGGVRTSQHTKGEAVDFICPSWGSPKLVCLALMDSKDILMYDQLILEPSWIHISFVSANPRMTELTYRNNIYHKGLL